MLGNLALSNSSATPTTITNVVVNEAGTYLVNAAGMVFTSVSGDRTAVDIARNGAELGGFFNQIGQPAANLPANYAITRLVQITTVPSTIAIRGWRDLGTGNHFAFSNSLEVTRVGSGIAPQSVASPATGTVGAG